MVATESEKQNIRSASAPSLRLNIVSFLPYGTYWRQKFAEASLKSARSVKNDCVKNLIDDVARLLSF